MVPTQNIISEGLQKELDQRIAAANGKVSSVRQELQKELHALEAQQGNSDGSQTTQVQVALILAEIRYLDSLTNAADAEAPKLSLWQRLGSMFAHKEA
jgi:hypothetical protein